MVLSELLATKPWPEPSELSASILFPKLATSGARAISAACDCSRVVCWFCSCCNGNCAIETWRLRIAWKSLAYWLNPLKVMGAAVAAELMGEAAVDILNYLSGARARMLIRSDTSQACFFSRWGYIGRLSTLRQHCSATGKLPSLCRESAYAAIRWIGTG